MPSGLTSFRYCGFCPFLYIRVRSRGRDFDLWQSIGVRPGAGSVVGSSAVVDVAGGTIVIVRITAIIAVVVVVALIVGFGLGSRWLEILLPLMAVTVLMMARCVAYLSSIG